MRKITISADNRLMDELREIARDDHKEVSEVIHDALANHVAVRRNPRSRRARRLSFLGIGTSGRRDISEVHEDLLWKRPSRARRSS